MDQNTLRSRQLNPCDHLFWKSRGYPERPWNWKQILEDTGYYDDDSSSEDSDSSDDYDSSEENDTYDSDDHCQRSNANNPNNDEYWRARGWPRRPNDWRERVRSGNVNHQRIQKPSYTTQTAYNATGTSGNIGSTSSNKTSMTQTHQNAASIPTFFSGLAFVTSVSNTTQTTHATPKTENVTQSTKLVNSTSREVLRAAGINVDRTSPAA